MESKKIELWENGLIVSVEDIERMVDLSSVTYLGITSSTISNQALLSLLREKCVKDLDLYEIEEMLKSEGYEVSTLNDFEESRDLVIWDNYCKTFGNLDDCETYASYEYWDGSNHKRVWRSDVHTEVEYDKDTRTCLDEWDGHNWTTGGTGNHEYVYKVITVDGESAEDTYMLVESSQWQGVQDTGKIMTLKEIVEHLDELGRDHEEYPYKKELDNRGGIMI